MGETGGRCPSRPRRSLCCSYPASFTHPAEIVAAWSVEDGVRVVWEVAKMVVVVKVVLLVWIQNNDRTEKWLTQSVAALLHEEFPLNNGGET